LKLKQQTVGQETSKSASLSFCASTPSPRIFSFSVIPVECAVSALRDVDWSPESFDCLKISSETKTILLSLAKTRLGMIPKPLSVVSHTEHFFLEAETANCWAGDQ
jgi:hypothetical protein